MSLRRITLCLFALCLTVPAFAQMNAAREKTSATVKGKTVTITYGSPSWGGQDRLGAAPTGTIWRLGMNQATEIESTGDLVVGDKTLAAGKYSLWAKKTGDNSWSLLFHPKTGIWGAPALKEGFVAETPLKLKTGAEHAEKLVISLTDTKGKAGIEVHWGTAVLSGDFGVK